MKPTPDPLTSAANQLVPSVDGIGHVLADSLLGIPDYQRSYSWESDEVEELWNDIKKAMDNRAPEYFLGSIVTTDTGGPRQHVIDGQQRLATVSLLYSAMRDLFGTRSDERRAEVEQQFLGRKNMSTRAWEPRLTVNAEDNDVFQDLVKGNAEQARGKAKRASHQRLMRAYNFLRVSLDTEIAGLDADKWPEPLVAWHEYLLNNAKVIRITVANESRAFVIFETLNDRGMNLSTSDLLKNHLFGTAGEHRVEECKLFWSQAMAPFATDEPGEVDDFLRQYWSSREGTARVKALFSEMREHVASPQDAVDLTRDLSETSPLWTSMFDRDAEFWKTSSDATKAALDVLESLRVKQCRPLLLAAMRRFGNTERKEMASLLSNLVNWSVRWLVAGGMGSGSTERLYAECAKKITDGTITTADQVAAEFESAVPNDEGFKSAFKTQQVKRSWVARYYLMALERENTNQALHS